MLDPADLLGERRARVEQCQHALIEPVDLAPQRRQDAGDMSRTRRCGHWDTSRRTAARLWLSDFHRCCGNRWWELGGLQILDRDRLWHADRHHGRQRLDRLQAEVPQKLRRGAVQERPAWAVLAPRDLDELLLDERLQRRAHVHAADRFDLSLGDRLTVRDDGQGLQRRGADRVRLRHLQRLLDPAGERLIGDQLVAAGHFLHRERAAGRGVLLVECAHDAAYLGAGNVREHLREPLEGEGLARNEQQRLDDPLSLGRVHGSPAWAPRGPRPLAAWSGAHTP